MSDRFHVLFLCTANSARSVLAEAVLSRLGGDRFRAFSAGSFPRGQVNPVALELLQSLGYDTSGFRSKSWDEFAVEGAPRIDLVVTVCDNAAGEICPIWPGHPLKTHWGIEDPASADGMGKQEAFLKAYGYLSAKIGRLVALPVETMETAALKAELDAIGRSEGATELAVGTAPANVIIYHNPECGTSRNTLAMIRNAGIEPHVIEYLKTPPSRAMLEQLIARAGMTPRELLRQKGTPYAELGLGDESLGDAALIDAMMAHPILLNRPLVVTSIGVKLCRPSEAVLDILPEAQRSAFTKEDGERVVDAAGNRIPVHVA